MEVILSRSTVLDSVFLAEQHKMGGSFNAVITKHIGSRMSKPVFLLIYAHKKGQGYQKWCLVMDKKIFILIQAPIVVQTNTAVSRHGCDAWSSAVGEKV